MGKVSHIIELCKKLCGVEAVDDWIRLFNAETEGELEMIRTRNVGIMEAVKELREMSLSRSLRAWRESRLKYERDRRGELVRTPEMREWNAESSRE